MISSMANDIEYRTPGQLLRELLDSHGWTQRVLAIVLGCNEAIVNHVIADRRAVDADMALAFEDVFGVPADRFLDLQKSYDLAKARLAARPDPGRSSRAQLYGNLPIQEMMKRGWLEADDIRKVKVVESALARFFGVSGAGDIEILPHAAKKTNVTGDVTPVQLAWLYRVKKIAGEMIVSRYSSSSVKDAIAGLRPLLVAAEEARKAPRVLAECGIRYVVVESLPGAKIDGVCFWLDEFSPVIAMTLRYDRIDNFWFVLRHELEHVLREHGKAATMLDTDLEGERAGTGTQIPDDERAANEAAADFCVPREKMESFMKMKGPLFSEVNIINFARTIHVHPGLVAGQLQHRTGQYNRFRNHQVKIRHIVRPNAMVDGWGDVAPTGT